MKPEDDFQLIRQHEAGELVFNRNFRGGPRSDDWIVFTITDGLDRGERAKRRFYQTLVRLLQEGPGVRPADVFVMMTVTPAGELLLRRRGDRHRRRGRRGARGGREGPGPPGNLHEGRDVLRHHRAVRAPGQRPHPADAARGLRARRSRPRCLTAGSSPAPRPSLSSSRGPPAAHRCGSPSTSTSIRSSSPLTTSSPSSPTRLSSRRPAGRWCCRTSGSSRRPAAAWSAPSSTRTRPPSCSSAA